jgi:hypothetical protein
MIKLFHKHIDKSDIHIYGKDLVNDTIKAGYNIGDLLNIPSLSGFWDALPHNSQEELERMYMVGNAYVDSILYYYIELRPHDEIIPYLYRVQGATDKFIQNSSVAKELVRVVDSNDVLCVHIRSGDKEVERSFLDLIVEMSREFNFVYIFSGLHLDERFATHDQKKENFMNSMNYLFEHCFNVTLILAEPDIHISLMKKAKHLLLHKGGFSAIGFIVCEGTLYTTKYLDTLTDIWFSNVNKKHIHLECI